MPFKFTSLLVAAILAVATASPLEPRQNPGPPSHRIFNIKNNCPTAINLISAGVFDSVIPAGGTTQKFATGFTPGPFYTDANGGQVGGIGSTKAMFWNDWHYTIIRDPNHLNTAISINPHEHESRQGLCVPITCPTSICNQAFDAPGATFLPQEDQVHPNLPWYSCPENDSLQWDITFCPSGSWPPHKQGGTLVPMHTGGKCLDVRGAVFANGTPVQIYECNGTRAQRWVLTRSPTGTHVRVANTNFCLDAGSSPANGIRLKIWTCYDNLPAQTWKWDSFGSRLSLAGVFGGKTLCADVRNGILTNGNPVDTWECANLNPNQVFSHPY